MHFLWGSLLLLISGGFAWAYGHHRLGDPHRFTFCFSGVGMVAVAIVLFAFFWHWIVGTFVILGIGYAGIKMIFRGRP